MGSMSMRSMNTRRSGPPTLGFRSTPFVALHWPASQRSGPRLASVSGSTSLGSVKMSLGKIIANPQHSLPVVEAHHDRRIGDRNAIAAAFRRNVQPALDRLHLHRPVGKLLRDSRRVDGLRVWHTDGDID